MRRVIVLTIATLAFVLALPALDVNAVCEPPPDATSAAGLRVMRSTPIIVWGTIEKEVPEDAHAQYSYFLKVRGYFSGIGGQRIEISDHADGDLPTDALRPGASTPATQEFLDRFGGQDAIVFARKDVAPYVGQYTTNICTYTAYGDSAVSDLLPLVRRTFGSPQAPTLSGTGPAAVPALMLAAAFLMSAGSALLITGHRSAKKVVALPRAAR
ncbi:MAG: hypothetical protein WAT66_10070 [Actinomycetota bacterium]